MAIFDTGKDLLVHLLRRAGDIIPSDMDTTNANRVIDAKLYLDDAHWTICAMRNWRWARKDPPVQIASTAKVTATVSAIAGSAVTLSANLSPSMAGRKFYLDGEAIPFRVSTHTAGSSAVVLAATYTGDLTSGACTFFQDEMTVATDILSHPTLRELHTGDWFEVIPEAEFRRLYPRNVNESIGARHGAFITSSKVVIHPWTTGARLFECSYNVRTDPLTFDGAATDTPLLPRERRQLLVPWALRKLLPDKRDGRLEVIEREIANELQLLSGADITFAKPRTYVRRGQAIGSR